MKILNKKVLGQNIVSRVKNDLENNNINGACVIVKQGGNTIYENTFGIANKNSIFRLASMTKPITAVAVMTLLTRDFLIWKIVLKSFFRSFRMFAWQKFLLKTRFQRAML